MKKKTGTSAAAVRSISSRPTRYGVVAISFHWVMALLVVVMLGVGLYMAELPLSPTKFEIYQMHKSAGVLVLLLAVGRLAWRVTHPGPVLPAGTPGWQKGLAHATHWSLYLLLLGLPLTGWLFSDAMGYHPNLFGVPLPVLMQPNAEWGAELKEAHEIGASVLMFLLGLHVAGALKQHFVAKTDVLQRMLPQSIKIPRLPVMVLGATLLLPLAAHAQVWNINPNASSLAFTANFNGQPVNGRFNNWYGKVFFDPDNLRASDITITVATNSVSTGEMGRDQTLQSPEWFGTQNFPNAVFKTTDIRHVAERNYVAIGTLSLAGISKPLSFPFKLTITEDKARMYANFPMSRGDFAVGKGVWQTNAEIADTVTLTVVVNAVKAR